MDVRGDCLVQYCLKCLKAQGNLIKNQKHGSVLSQITALIYLN